MCGNSMLEWRPLCEQRYQFNVLVLEGFPWGELRIARRLLSVTTSRRIFLFTYHRIYVLLRRFSVSTEEFVRIRNWEHDVPVQLVLLVHSAKRSLISANLALVRTMAHADR
jgi:hypothetical protein